VLEPVVHHHEVDLRMLGQQTADALRTLLAHRNHNLRELELDLQGLVAHVAVVRVGPHLEIPLRPAAVAARNERHTMELRHVVEHHLGHRSLARAADGDVADADDGHVEPLALEDPPVEQTVTERHSRFIEHGHGGEQAFEHRRTD